MDVTIYHNPRCSKSRATLELLEARGIEPTIVEYLQTPPSRETLRDILSALGLSPMQLVRKKEACFEEAGLANPDASDDAVIEAMLAHPILIERPIVLANGKAAIGRPPEAVLEIL